jgi:hypothetical protein
MYRDTKNGGGEVDHGGHGLGAAHIHLSYLQLHFYFQLPHLFVVVLCLLLAVCQSTQQLLLLLLLLLRQRHARCKMNLFICLLCIYYLFEQEI